jgi:hypothetical protein
MVRTSKVIAGDPRLSIAGLRERQTAVRTLLPALCETHSHADATVQFMPDTPPAKWHLGPVRPEGDGYVAPRGHARASYRNFFSPHRGWRFTGARLAQDI